MKTRIRIGVLIMAALLALSTCNLFNAISVQWSIDTFGGALGSRFVDVTYTVWNPGKYDLSGVNLEIGVNVQGFGYISSWTLPDFSLAQGQTKSGTWTVDIGPAHTILSVPANPTLTNLLDAAVLGVDMDKPNG